MRVGRLVKDDLLNVFTWLVTWVIFLKRFFLGLKMDLLFLLYGQSMLNIFQEFSFSSGHMFKKEESKAPWSH